MDVGLNPRLKRGKLTAQLSGRFCKYRELICAIQKAQKIIGRLKEDSGRKLVSAGDRAELPEAEVAEMEYQKFKKVKEIISRYVAKDRVHFERLLERFAELTGKKDDTGRNIGYRTRMVHMGEQLEHIIPDHKARRELFSELDRYIRPVVEHMIEHSTSALDDYCKVREKLRPDRIEPTEEEIPF